MLKKEQGRQDKKQNTDLKKKDKGSLRDEKKLA